jgi:hypothetical protein
MSSSFIYGVPTTSTPTTSTRQNVLSLASTIRVGTTIAG